MEHLPQQAVYGDNARLEVEPMIPREATSALDVGCGEGGFGRTLRSIMGPNARIIGVDAVPANVIAAEQDKGYTEVIQGYFPEALTESNEKFDLITFLDVLEHINDPLSTLAITHEFLAPGGRVMAAIPSVQVWTLLRQMVRGRWDYTDTGTLDRTHVRFFTRATMIEMFESAGFIVEECQGVNSQRPPLKPVRNFFNRRLLIDMKWLPYLLPDSAWLQFVIVGRRV